MEIQGANTARGLVSLYRASQAGEKCFSGGDGSGNNQTITQQLSQ